MQITTDRRIDTLPKGWSIANEPEIVPHEEALINEHVLDEMLQQAAASALKMIADLQRKVHMSVPAAYMRIEEPTVFHILLMVSREDYLSPHMSAAKILALQYTLREQRFDIKFSFTNIEENTMKSVIIRSGYRLKYTSDAQAEQVHTF